MVWNDLKRIMEGKHCTTINLLVREIIKWWQAHQNNLEYCNKKFDHIYSREGTRGNEEGTGGYERELTAKISYRNFSSAGIVRKKAWDFCMFLVMFWNYFHIYNFNHLNLNKF